MDSSLDLSDSSSWRKPGQRLRKAVIEQDGSTAEMKLSNECPLQQYIRVCDVVINNFMEHSVDTKEDLLQAYVLGSRLQNFLSDGIPSHDDYDFFTAQHCNEKLLAVQQYLNELALRIDEQEHANFIGEVISSSREDESCIGGSPKAKTSPTDTSLSLMLVSAGSGETPAEYGPRIHDSFNTENSILSKTDKPKRSDCFREMDAIREMHAGSFEERNSQFSANKMLKKKMPSKSSSSPPRPKVKYGIANQQDALTELASGKDFATFGQHNASQLSRASNGTEHADLPGQSNGQVATAGVHTNRHICISPRAKRREKVDGDEVLNLSWRPSLQPSLDPTHYVSSSSSCESSPLFQEHQICAPRISKPRILPESLGPNVPRVVRSAGLATSNSFFEIIAPGQTLSSEQPAPQTAIAQKGVFVRAKDSSGVARHVRNVAQRKTRIPLCGTVSDEEDVLPQLKEVDPESSTSKSCLRWPTSTSVLSQALNNRSNVATVAPAWQSPCDSSLEELKQKCQPQQSPVDVNGFPVVEELPAIPPGVSPSPDVSRKLTYSTTDTQHSPQRISFRSHAAEMLSIGGRKERRKASQNATGLIYDTGFKPTDEDVLDSNPSWVSWSDVEFEPPSQRSSSDRDDVVDSLRPDDSERETFLRKYSARSLDLPSSRENEPLRRVSFKRSSTTDNVRILKSTALQSPRLAATSHMLDERIKNHFKRSSDAVQFAESVETVNDDSGAQLFFDRPGDHLVEDRSEIGYGLLEENGMESLNQRTKVGHGRKGENTVTWLPSVRFVRPPRPPIKAYSTGTDNAVYTQSADSDCNVEMMFNPHRNEQVNRRCRLNPLACPNRSGGAANAIRHEGPVDLDDSDLAEWDGFGNPPKRGCTRFFSG